MAYRITSIADDSYHGTTCLINNLDIHNESMLAPPEEKDGFKGLIMTIDPDGGGDNLENGLDAITYAIRSDWTDASTHEAGFAGKSQYYPK